jgi:hypothetical protein
MGFNSQRTHQVYGEVNSLNYFQICYLCLSSESYDTLLLLLVIRAQSQGSGYTAAIRLIVHPVF